MPSTSRRASPPLKPPLPPRRFEQLARDAFYVGALAGLSPVLLYRFAKGKYRTGWGNKFGFVPARDDRKRIWIHAVSVGEAVAAGILAGPLLRALPGYECVASTTTPTGQDVARKRFGPDHTFYLPLDFSGFVRRALARTKPDALVLTETEIWPNLISAARDAGVPVAIVNGRISDRAFAKYLRFSRYFRRTMGRIDLCAVQTDAYAERFRRLGVRDERLVVTGSLKYDGVKTGDDPEARHWARDVLRVERDDRVLLGGSTHASEELALAEAWRGMPGRPRWRLVIAPRHPPRIAAVESELARAGFATVRRTLLTDGRAVEPDRIVLVDTVGELGRLYHTADLVFVGGSMIPHGGQNPVEPAGIGKATVFGPHMFNFEETVEVLREASGAVQVGSAAHLASELGRLASDLAAREALGAAARAAIRKRQGAAELTAGLIAKVLARRT